MHKILLLVCLLFFSDRVLSQHEPRRFDIKTFKGEFKHFNLKTFDIDSLSEAERDLRLFSENVLVGGVDRYYSKQQNKRGLNEFSIYYWEGGEIVTGFRMIYLIFNSKGELISSFELASKLGGNGYESESHGTFINENEYTLYVEYKDALGQPIIEKTIVKIKPNGEIETLAND